MPQWKNPDILKVFHKTQIPDPEKSSAVVTKSFDKPKMSFLPTKPLSGHRSPDTISL